MSGQDEWRWADPAGQQRLVRTDELRAGLASGAIPPNAPVWRSGWKEWQPAHAVPELTTSALSAANGVVPNIPPPPLQVVAVQRALEALAEPMRPRLATEPPLPPSYVPAPSRSPASLVPSAPPGPSARPQPAPNERPARRPVAPEANLATKPLHVLELAARGAPPGPPSPGSSGAIPNAADSRPQKGGAKTAEDSWGFRASAPAAVPKDFSSSDVVALAAGSTADLGSLSVDGAERVLSAAAPSRRAADTRAVDLKRATLVGVAPLHPSGGIATKPPVAPASTPRAPAASPVSSPPRPSAAPRGPQSFAPANPKTKPAETLIFPTRPPPPDDLDDATQVDVRPVPPIVVPGGRPPVPNSVTQPPPWTADGGDTSPEIPKSQRAPNLGEFRIEELSASAFEESDLTVESRFDGFPHAHGGVSSMSGAELLESVKHLSTEPPPLPPRSRSGPPQPSLRPSTAGGSPNAPPRTPPPPPAKPRDGATAPVEQSHPYATLGSALSSASVPPPPRAPDAIDIDVDFGMEAPPTTSPAAGRFAGAAGPLPRAKPGVARLADPIVHTVLRDLERLKRASRKTKVMVGAAAAGGLVVTIGLVGLLVGAVRGGGGDKARAATPEDRAVASGAGDRAHEGDRAAGRGAALGGTAGPSSARFACNLVGDVRAVAPRALVATGVEVVSLGSRVGIGYASGPREAWAVEIDPETLEIERTDRPRAQGTLRRVTPASSPNGFYGIADFDRKRDVLDGRRVVDPHKPFDVGLAPSRLAWAPRASDRVATLFSLEGEEPVEALRGVRVETGGAPEHVVVFRRRAAIWAGWVPSDRKAQSEDALVRVDGLGTQVGSPAIAASGASVIVAWADRASTEDRWSLRYFVWKRGGTAAKARAFATPPGGLGEHVMSPGVTGLGDGRFLLLWTEGPVASHQVRGIVLGPEGEPEGGPIVVSPDGLNAGQAQAAFTADGRGLVAFLASRGQGFEVIAASIRCGARP